MEEYSFKIIDCQATGITSGHFKENAIHEAQMFTKHVIKGGEFIKYSSFPRLSS